MNSTVPELPRAERAHLLFRGSAEVCKLGRSGAVLLELAAVVLSYVALTHGDGTWKVSQPLVALALVFLAAGFRLLSKNAGGYAPRCRRASAQAFAFGVDIDAKTLADMESDAPIGAAGVGAKMFDDSSLPEYYEVECDPGSARLREMYAHSALFTWRLLRVGGWAVAGFATAALLAAIVGLYLVGLLDEPRSATMDWLDLICGLVLARVALVAFATAIDMTRASREIRRLWDRLLDPAAQSDHRILELTHEYDIARASQPPVPTWPYFARRSRLSEDWHMARRQLMPEATGPAA